jgi:hypothetical protein
MQRNRHKFWSANIIMCRIIVALAVLVYEIRETWMKTKLQPKNEEAPHRLYYLSFRAQGLPRNSDQQDTHVCRGQDVGVPRVSRPLGGRVACGNAAWRFDK